MADNPYILTTKCFGIGHDCDIITKDGAVFHYSCDTNEIYVKGTRYTISFDKNQTDATGSMSSVIAYSGKKWTCPQCGYSSGSYTAKSYNTKADGTGVTYEIGKEYDFPAGDLTLYVIWQHIKDVFIMLETCCNAQGCTTLEGDKYNPRITYEMIKQQYSGLADKAEIHILVDRSSPTIGSYKNESPTKANIKKYIQKGVSGDYKLAIFMLSDHGSPLGVLDGSISGKEFATWIKAGSKDTRILFIMDCCHAENVAPFSAAPRLAGAAVRDVLDEAPKNDLMDEMFDEFDAMPKPAFASAANSAMPLAAASNENTNPVLLGWYTCDGSHIGWSGYSGSEFICRLSECFSKGISYKDMFAKCSATPYWYFYEWGKTNYQYYGYSASKPSKCKKGTVSAYHKKRNHNGQFDESLKAFT